MNPNNPQRLEVVVLAAGKGTRMKSALPKVLHDLGGKPLLRHVVDCAAKLKADAVHIIYGYGGQQIKAAIADNGINWIEQRQQLGTGHAVAQAMAHVEKNAQVLVLYGDVPLISVETLEALVSGPRGTLSLLSATLGDAAGYGRIVRDGAGAVLRIVEKKDASENELAIREINTGFMAAPANKLCTWLKGLGSDNAQGEYYLTDVIAMAVEDGVEIVTCAPQTLDEILGVNSKHELAYLERAFQLMQARKLMDEGVMLRDPSRFDLRGTMTIGHDVSIDVNVVLEGKIALGSNVSIGPNCCLKNVSIGDASIVLANSVLEDCNIGSACRIGPFARIRPETILKDKVHVGNFVEIKKSNVNDGSKINHMSYVGDSSVGKNVNIGAGTITCNYDGAYKHRTIIGDNVFIGSDTQLIAPITVNDNATIGAGTTLTKDVPANELTLSRSLQKTISGWKRPVKEKE